MVRKVQYSREDVVDAAFNVVKKLGIDSLSARNVAHELGSSTAPVYSNFERMEKLEEAVFAAAAQKFLNYTRTDHTGNTFLNMGIGVLIFARECPKWYFAFSAKRQSGQFQMEEIFKTLLHDLADLPDLAGLPELERIFLLRKMGIFTHGLASEICSGNVDDQAMLSARTLLQEVGAALTKDALTREPRTEEELERMAVLGCPSREMNRVPELINPKDEGNGNT